MQAHCAADPVLTVLSLTGGCERPAMSAMIAGEVGCLQPFCFRVTARVKNPSETACTNKLHALQKTKWWVNKRPHWGSLECKILFEYCLKIINIVKIFYRIRRLGTHPLVFYHQVNNLTDIAGRLNPSCV